jgi:predicted nucleic acid-binding protein
MLQVSLDTSFLITFSDPGRPNHPVAVNYFRYCLNQRIPMALSTIAAGEFEVRQPVSDLPLQNFRVLPYNLLHSIRAAALFRALQEDSHQAPEERRPIIINDLKILAQAEEEGISVILTEDANTLSRLADRLRRRGEIQARCLLLTEGFTPGRLETPAQDELRFSPTPVQ